MNTELIEPFVNATVSVFSTMLGCPLKAGNATDSAPRDMAYDVTGIIGMSGKSTGVVMLHMTKKIAINSSSAMLGSKATEINADVIDAVGELTNMIAGSAKTALSPIFENVALPLVLVGQPGAISFPSRTSPTCIPFDSPWGPLSVEIDVRDTRRD